MTKIMRVVPFFVLLFSLLGIRPAAAKDFVSLPKIGGKNKNLKIRVVRYTGSTNGGMVVDVKNGSNKAQKFVADGLFFVPAGDPEKAPQRLGAAGPFQEIAKNGHSKHKQVISIKPGETKQLSLEVFCIDSHRGSPSPNTQFTVAEKRLPKKMRRAMKKGNDAILLKNEGDVTKSKSAIQSNMWKTRDQKWIKLEGERKKEKAPRTQLPRRIRNQAPMQEQRRR